MELNRKRRDFMRNAALAAAATFTPGMSFGQKADSVEDELERRLMLAQGMGMGGGETVEPPAMPERPTIVDFMRLRFYDAPGGGIQQNSHMLQSANLALKAGYDEKVVVACALHDTGHQIKRVDHGHWGSNLVEGYVDEEISWAIKYHQSLRFFPDPDYNYEYPEMYVRIFGEGYVPDAYQKAHHDYAKGHEWYHTARVITVNDVYGWDEDAQVDYEPIFELVAKHFRTPPEGLGFDNSHNAHFWRSIIWPNRRL